MPDIHVHVHLDGGASSVTTLHIHIPVVHDPELVVKVDAIMAGVTELMAKVSEVSTSVQNVLGNVTEIVKDVQRLLANGDTQGAIDALAGAKTALDSANSDLVALDAAVEATSPEPQPAPETPAPTTGDELPTE